MRKGVFHRHDSGPTARQHSLAAEIPALHGHDSGKSVDTFANTPKNVPSSACRKEKAGNCPRISTIQTAASKASPGK